MPDGGLLTAALVTSLSAASSAWIAGTAITGAILLKAAVVGVGIALLSRFLAPSQPRVGNDRLETRNNVQATQQPARWILGRARVAVQLVRIATAHGNINSRRSDQLWAAFYIANGACDDIERVWLSGEEVTFSRSVNDSGTIILSGTGKWSGALKIYCYLKADGTQGEEARSITRDDAYRPVAGDGLSWCFVHLTQPPYDRSELDEVQSRLYSSIPGIDMLVKGLKFTWPGQTDAAWTDNAAACRYWYETTRRGWSADAIDVAEFDASYSLCEEEVHLNLPSEYDAYPPDSKRYTINGVVYSDDDPQAISDQMSFAMAGEVIESGGQLLIRAGKDRLAAQSIAADHLLSPPQHRPMPALNERLNAVKATLSQSAVHDYLELDIPEYIDEDALDRDEIKLTRSVGSLNFVNNPATAIRLLAIQLRKQRAAEVVEVMLTSGPSSDDSTLR